jgi:hypothetical protein
MRLYEGAQQGNDEGGDPRELHGREASHPKTKRCVGADDHVYARVHSICPHADEEGRNECEAQRPGGLGRGLGQALEEIEHDDAVPEKMENPRSKGRVIANV